MMNNTEQNQLAERFRSRMHEDADMICDTLLMKMEMESVGRSVQAEPATQPESMEVKAGLPSRMKLQDIISMYTQIGIRPVEVKLQSGVTKQAASWKGLAEVLLRECAEIPECMEWMRNEAWKESECNVGFSHKRVEPGRSVKVADGLYFNFRTSIYYLLKRLMNVMEQMGYDHSQIGITVRQGKTHPKDVIEEMPIKQIRPHIVGRKPTKLLLSNGKEFLLDTWAEVVRELFKDCYDDPTRSKKLEALADNFYSPRGKLLLSKTPNALSQPFLLGEGFLLEVTSASDITMARMIRLLESVGYDCDNTTVSLEDRQRFRLDRYGRQEDDQLEEEAVGPTMSM